jgi:hypothetical protein
MRIKSIATLLLLTGLSLSACVTPTPAALPTTAAPITVTATEPPTASPTLQAAALPSATSQPASLPLATPISAEPAAGICAEAEGETAVVEIFPDIPSPRCLKVTADQRLVVINRGDTDISLGLGSLAAVVRPGEEHTLDMPFGEYLAPGVHRLQAEPYSGPEVWLAGD